MPEWWWKTIGLTMGVGLGMLLAGIITALPDASPTSEGRFETCPGGYNKKDACRSRR
jgi:hypothetical protein